VDYSGKRVGIVDPSTSEIRQAEIFVGVHGASNLTYAEATWTQTLPDWTSEADAREQHDAARFRLSVPYLDGFVDGDLAGDA
jgi:transposase